MRDCMYSIAEMLAYLKSVEDPLVDLKDAIDFSLVKQRYIKQQKAAGKRKEDAEKAKKENAEKPKRKRVYKPKAEQLFDHLNFYTFEERDEMMRAW